MAKDKNDSYFDNRIKNDRELLSGNQESDIEKIKQETKKSVPKPGQLFAEFVKGQGGRQDIEKPGTDYKIPESKTVKTTWADKFKNDIEP